MIDMMIVFLCIAKLPSPREIKKIKNNSASKFRKKIGTANLNLNFAGSYIKECTLYKIS